MSGLIRSRTASVVSATVAPASAAIAWMRDGARFIRGGYTGTATTAAY